MAIDKAVDSAKLDADLASVADAIRAKGGTSEKLAFPAGYVDAVNAIQTGGGGGGQELADSIIDGSVTEIVSNAKIVKSKMFYECKNLVSAIFTQASAVKDYAFASCDVLQTVEFPQATNIWQFAFNRCKSIQKMELPQVSRIETSAFDSCESLRTVKLQKANSIGIHAFYFCSALQTVVIATNKVCQLADISAFNHTPIKDGTGYIYVPKALVEEYKAATNWSTFAAQIRAIEDYPDITGG